MGFYDELVPVEDGEAVDDMSTEIWVDVAGEIFASALPIPSPVCEVTYNLERLIIYY